MKTQASAIAGIEASWNAIGAVDPMFGVLSDPEKLGGRWDREAFYATGRTEIDEAFAFLESCGRTVARSRALDFGCGVGRLSAALAERFDDVTAVDIAPAMLQRASAEVRAQNIRWTLNPHPDLRMFPDAGFDFIYSNIVLQHMPPRLSAGYIAEFVRVLARGGTALFQLPDRAPYDPRRRIQRAVAQLLPYAPRPLIDAYRRAKYRGVDPDVIARLPRVLMEMHGASPQRVRALVERSGGRIVAQRLTPRPDPGWHSYEYVVERA